jgi:hypothetical protein
MARSHGIVKTTVWEPSSDFRDLTLAGQWCYVMLFSQPAINNVGVLPYVPEKWARYSADLTRRQLDEALDELEANRYLVRDEDTGELLVRTFVKHDRIWKQPNLVKSARREYQAVESERIRRTLADLYPWLADWDLDPTGSETPSETPTGTPSETPSETPSAETPSLTPSETPSGTPKRRGPRARARVRASPTPTPPPTPTPGLPSTESSSTRARETADDENDSHHDLDALHPTPEQRTRWLTALITEPERLRACLTYALTADRPAAMLDHLLANGSHPHPDKPTLAPGATGTRSTPTRNPDLEHRQATAQTDALALETEWDTTTDPAALDAALDELARKHRITYPRTFLDQLRDRLYPPAPPPADTLETLRAAGVTVEASAGAREPAAAEPGPEAES